MRVLILGYLAINLSLQAQSVQNLVFEGGGMRGVSYAGVLTVLEKYGHLDSLQRVGGSSVGAITALMICLRYTPKEIENEIAAIDPRKFNDGTVLFFGGPTRLRKHYGWYKGKKVSQWISSLIERKTGNPEITFRELHDRGKPDLYITGTSLNNQRVLIFSYLTFPEMKVRDAVRISMSAPFIFKPVIIDSTGKIIKKAAPGMKHDILVDGGFIANYPIDLFDARDGLGKRIPNPATLGVRLDTPNQLEYDKQNMGLAPWPIHSFRSFVGAFYNFTIENLNRSNLTADDWERTISISSALVGAKIRRLGLQERTAMVEAGRLATMEYLESRSKK